MPLAREYIYTYPKRILLLYYKEQSMTVKQINNLLDTMSPEKNKRDSKKGRNVAVTNLVQ